MRVPLQWAASACLAVLLAIWLEISPWRSQKSHAAEPLQEDCKELGKSGYRCGPIIVVGGGIAGLAAAQTLHRAGYKVIVFEAGQDLGGRTKTFRHGPFKGMEQGAQWVHGGEKNSAVESLVRFFNMSLHLVGGTEEFEGSEDKHHVIHNGTSAPDLKERAFQLYRGALKLFSDHDIKRLMRDGDISVRHAWELALNASNFQENSSGLERMLLDWQLRVRNEQTTGSDMRSAGAGLHELATYEAAASSYGVGDAEVTGGFSSLVDHLAEGLDIRLASAVRSISSLQGAHEVVVATENETFRGAAVIVTVSVGVLQARSIKFEPELPEAWWDSLFRFQMSNVSKILVKFHEGRSPVLKDSYLTSRLVSLDDAKLTYYCTCSSVTSSCPEMFSCFVAGASAAEALRLREVSEAALHSRVVEELQEMYPGLSESAVDVVQLVSFSRDPFVRGSWISGKVNSSSDDFDIFRPRGRLLWAGEGTCRLMYASVQAAIVSGSRAAHHILLLDDLLPSEDPWPLFQTDLVSLCDSVPKARLNEICSWTCPQIWSDLNASVPSQFLPWHRMTPAARRNWQNLGWSSMSWSRQTRMPSSSRSLWQNLTLRQQLAAQRLGYFERLWDDVCHDQSDIVVCRISSRHFRSPADCMEERARYDWHQLGFTLADLTERTSWDGGETWSRLKSFERTAALRIGFRPGYW